MPKNKDDCGSDSEKSKHESASEDEGEEEEYVVEKIVDKRFAKSGKVNIGLRFDFNQKRITM